MCSWRFQRLRYRWSSDKMLLFHLSPIGIDEMRQSMLAAYRWAKLTTADDIAQATLFLASDMARNISGQVLAVDAVEPAG